MALNTCECCLKPETACDCLGARSFSCDFCGETIKPEATFYESKAVKLLEGGPDECGPESAVLSCEACEERRMRVGRWRRFFWNLFRGGRP